MMRVRLKLIRQFTDVTVLHIVSCLDVRIIVGVWLLRRGYLLSLLRKFNEMKMNRLVVELRRACW